MLWNAEKYEIISWGPSWVWLAIRAQKLILRVTPPPHSVQTWRFPASKFDRPCPFMNL